MRYLLLVLLTVILFTANIIAQDTPISKGSKLIGGSISFESMSGDLYEDEEGNSLKYFSFSPEFGYFVSDGFGVGGMIEYERGSQGDYTETGFMFGPLLGYFFKSNASEVKGSVYPYLKGFFLYGTFKEDDGVTEYKAKSMIYGAMGGIDYMISNSIALEAGVRFSFDRIKPDDIGDITFEWVDGTNFGISLGFDLFIY